MLTLRRAASAVALLTCSTFASPAHAVWPPPENVTREQIADPMFWPNDPGYAPGARDYGEWAHWSWVPRVNQMLPGFRTEEAMLGTGNNTDRAWGISIGDPRVLIAITDSGINWDSDDVQTQAALNINELPLPMGATSYDANADGTINVLDYLDDPRIPCGTALPHPLRGCVGAGGMANDPNGNGVFDAGDLIRVFSDGMDDDRNGYTDDIAGWDFFKDDNDPADDTHYGHGSGEARWSVGAGNNGLGSIGSCPRCQFVMTRIADSFIGEVNDVAQGIIYAADADYGQNRRVRVMQVSVGTVDNSTYAQRAIDYAFSRGLTVIASAADENSRHHNAPSTNNHTVVVHAIRYNQNTEANSTSFLAFNNCSNYGAQVQLSVAGKGCASEATGQSAGITGLIYSTAIQRGIDPPLNGGEVRQLYVSTADDVNVPESLPTDANYDRTIYPSLPGFDQRFGYGRVNARRAVEAVRDRRIPPEVDMVSPRMFSVLNPLRPAGQRLRIEGNISARRAPRFDYTVEWARGVEPADTEFTQIRRETNVTAPVTNVLGELDLTSVVVDNPGERENRYAITVRIRAVAHYDAPIGDVVGEDRRAFYVLRDETALPGFPVDVGGSGESSPHMADLNGDGRREIVLATADGRIHAFQGDGTEIAGFPVHTNLELGLDPSRMPSYLAAPAYSGATPPIDPTRVYEAVTATPGIADLDGDGQVEIVVSSYKGTVYVFNRDGTPYGHGFPHRLDAVPSSANSASVITDRGIFGSPVLVDLNGDGRREIVFGAFDGKLYALDSMTAGNRPGFPVDIHFPEPNTERNRVFAGVGVGNFDGDGIPDIVVPSSEKLPGNNNSGAFYLVHGDGNNHAGGPFHANWPIAFISFNFFPLVGEGVSTSPAIGDIDGDGRDELSLTGNALPSIVLARGVQPPHSARPDPGSLAQILTLGTSMRGPRSDSRSNPVTFGAVISLGSFGDLTNDGTLEYVTSGASLNLAISISSGGRRVPFEHLLNAWDARSGRVVPGFPRIIEDYTFFQNPVIADVSGDAYAETILGTGGYYVHAFDACGREAPGFPKFTGQWVIPSPSVADIDGDSNLDVAVNTRSGYLYAWRTQGRTTGSVQWPTFRHDNANTGNYGTALDFGVRRVEGTDPIVCPALETPDAGVTEDATADANADARDERPSIGGGCGCRTVSGRGGRGAMFATVALGFALATVRRRRRVAAGCGLTPRS